MRRTLERALGASQLEANRAAAAAAAAAAAGLGLGLGLGLGCAGGRVGCVVEVQVAARVADRRDQVAQAVVSNRR